MTLPVSKRQVCQNAIEINNSIMTILSSRLSSSPDYKYSNSIKSQHALNELYTLKESITVFLFNNFNVNIK